MYWIVVCVTLHLSSTVQEPFIQDAIKVQVYMRTYTLSSLHFHLPPQLLLSIAGFFAEVGFLLR